MKKVISVSLMLLFGLSVSTFARTTYNPDNTINVSSTIRGQKKLREQRISERRKFEQAAAAVVFSSRVSLFPFPRELASRKWEQTDPGTENYCCCCCCCC